MSDRYFLQLISVLYAIPAVFSEIVQFCMYALKEYILYGVRDSYKFGASKKISVILNGASLNIDDVDIESIVYCCNMFCFTDKFSQLRPKVYVIADPQLLNSDSKVLDCIVRNTNWKMNVFVPLMWRDKVKEKISQNKNLMVSCFPNAPIPDFAFLSRGLYQKLGYFPYAINVSIPMMSLALHCNPEKVEVFGMDLSYYRYFSVNGENESYLKPDYFYQKDDEKYLYYIYCSRKGGKVKGRSEDFFNQMYQTCKGHRMLSCLLFNKTKVVNRSPESVIDVWDKK